MHQGAEVPAAAADEQDRLIVDGVSWGTASSPEGMITPLFVRGGLPVAASGVFLSFSRPDAPASPSGRLTLVHVVVVPDSGKAGGPRQYQRRWWWLAVGGVCCRPGVSLKARLSEAAAAERKEAYHPRHVTRRRRRRGSPSAG
jgi:hypothetical protein